MANYEFSYASSEAILVTPEKYLELRSFFPDIQVLKIIPPSAAKNDFGKILVLASSMRKESITNGRQLAQ